MDSVKITTEATRHSDILKFSLSRPLALERDESIELSREDNLSGYPLAAALFQFPFVSKIFITAGFIAIKKGADIDWDLIREDLTEALAGFLKEEIPVKKTKRGQAVTVYVEMTPNPRVRKFVANRMLTDTKEEYKKTDQENMPPVAIAFFKRDETIGEIFIKENYVVITKDSPLDWDTEQESDLRNYIIERITEGSFISGSPQKALAKPVLNRAISPMEAKIIKVLEEYIDPGVSADGGHIEYRRYDAATGEVEVSLQGACSGCPSAVYTLKNAIEQTLKSLLGEDTIRAVKAV